MNDEQLFRIILLAGAAVFMPIGLYHRFQAHTGEKLDRRQEGIFILVTLRLAGLAAMAGWIAYLIRPSSMAWAAVPLPGLVRWSGVVLGLCGSLLLVWIVRTLGRNLTDTVVTRKQHSLVTTGPYRWVRHPFYLAAAVLVAATFLVTESLFILTTGSLILLLLVLRTRKEEENLIARFGEDYRSYMKRTGRILPRWRGGWLRGDPP